MSDPDILRPMRTHDILTTTFKVYSVLLAALIMVSLFPHAAFLLV